MLYLTTIIHEYTIYIVKALVTDSTLVPLCSSYLSKLYYLIDGHINSENELLCRREGGTGGNF